MTFFNKLTYTLDEAFKVVVVFLMCFVWTLLVKKELLPALIYAAALSTLILFLLHFVFKKKDDDKKASQKKRQAYLTFLTSCKLSPSTFLNNMLNAIYTDYENKENFLQKNEEALLINLSVLDEQTLFSTCSNFAFFKTLTIITSGIDKKCEILIKKIKPLEINIITLEKFYFENQEKLDSVAFPLTLSNDKLYTLKLLFISALSKDKAKKYFFASIILIFSILFTPYKLLYTIFAFLCLLLALLSKLKIVA